MKRLAITAISLLALAACGGGQESSSFDAVEPALAPPPVSQGFAESKRGAPAPLQADLLESEPANPSDPISTDEQYIAYSYNRGLRLPQEQVGTTLDAHLQSCLAAGPATCIVVNSNIYKPSDDYTNGNLSLRATPEWTETFLAGLKSDAESAGGDIISQGQRAEDLTRAIIDTDERLKAQITLQTRLRTLLETRDGALGDILATERELARVTGQIESIRSNLKAMRLRVSMSSIDISYETKRSITDTGRSNPLARAFGDFFHNLSSAFAAVINAFAFGLPWLFLIGVMIFIWLRAIWPWVKRRRKAD